MNLTKFFVVGIALSGVMIAFPTSINAKQTNNSKSAVVLSDKDLEMNAFIDNLLSKMTLEEKLGQLNLPAADDIVTGQAKDSNVGEKVAKGLVGGVFNIKGIEKIRDLQRVAVEDSRLGIPLIFGMDVIHGYETVFPYSFGIVVQLGYECS